MFNKYRKGNNTESFNIQQYNIKSLEPFPLIYVSDILKEIVSKFVATKALEESDSIRNFMKRMSSPKIINRCVKLIFLIIKRFFLK